jgi:GxxExxY protein
LSKIILKEESYKIMDACFEVYKTKGCGFLESVYHECLAVEFGLQKIPFVSKPRIQLDYKGVLLNQAFEPDFICFGKVIVEIKATSKLAREHKAQTINYLQATKFELALLVNFGHYPLLEHERFGNVDGYRTLLDQIVSRDDIGLDLEDLFS